MKMIDYVVGICPHCGQKIRWREGEEPFVNENGETVCEDCREMHYRECKECGAIHASVEMKWVQGYGYVCDDCISGDRSGRFSVCEDCGEITLTEDGFWVGQYDDRFVCDSCYENYSECYECGHCVHENMTNTDHRGRIICDECYNEHGYQTCDSCGDTFRGDELYYDDDCDRHYCESCWEDREQERSGVMDYHEFNPNRYHALRVDGEKKGLTFGVELEADDGDFDADDFSDWVDDDYRIHFESDGSLSSSGVELITQPCSLKYHQEKMGWDKLCGNLISQGFKSHNTSCCGLHVHIGRKHLLPTTIVKLDVFINRAYEFFSQIARRNSIYCGSYIPNKKAEIFKARCCSGSHSDRYTAVNTTNRKTVEIRIFRGSLKTETVVGTIELIDALVNFLDSLPVVKIYETDVNVLKFVEWIGENRKRYKCLLPMLKRLVKSGIAVPSIANWCERFEKENEKGN